MARPIVEPPGDGAELKEKPGPKSTSVPVVAPMEPAALAVAPTGS